MDILDPFIVGSSTMACEDYASVSCYGGGRWYRFIHCVSDLSPVGLSM